MINSIQLFSFAFFLLSIKFFFMFIGHHYFFHILCTFFFWIGCLLLYLFELWFPHLESEGGRCTVSKIPSASGDWGSSLSVLRAASALLPEAPSACNLVEPALGLSGISAGELQEARFLLLFSCASSSLKKAVLEIARQSWNWTSVRAACRHQEYLFSLFALSLGRLCGFLHTVLMKPWPASVQCP